MNDAMNTMNNATALQQLTSPEADTRMAAAMVLGARPSAEVAQALVERLGAETDPTVRETLTWATVQQGAAAVPLVTDALSSDDAAVRSQAAHVLSKIGAPEVAPQLEAVVADRDPQVAIKGFRAAAAPKDPVVVPWLIARLGDGDAEVRDALAKELARLGELAVPALIETLASDDANARRDAVDVLGHLGGPAADPAAERLGELATDADDETRVAAVAALGELTDDSATQALQKVAEGEGTLATIATSALARQERRRADLAEAEAAAKRRRARLSA